MRCSALVSHGGTGATFEADLQFRPGFVYSFVFLPSIQTARDKNPYEEAAGQN